MTNPQRIAISQTTSPKIKSATILIAMVVLMGAHTSISNGTEVSLDRFHKGEIIVAFQKDVSRERAQAMLDKYSLDYENTIQINLGKHFFMKVARNI